jgi:hypothetical protein
MTLRRPRPLAHASRPTEADVERVINGGSPSAVVDPHNEPDIKFQMVIPAQLCSVIDELRRPTRTSRRAWILQAVYEKLEREGRLTRLVPGRQP